MFSSSNSTPRLLARFLAAGIANTAIGFSVIVVLMLIGVVPLLANTAGYAVGLVLSFLLNKQFVFMAGGRPTNELARFIAAFAASFATNLVVLHSLIGSLDVNAYVAQVLAACSYTGVMFALCNKFVFVVRKRSRRT
jgi:putative flippase GtrA